MINRGKRSKRLSEVKPVENISKNLHRLQKEVLLLHKLRDHAYEYQNPFRLKKDNPSQRNRQNPSSYPSSSHIEQKYWKSWIQGKIHFQQNSNKGLKYS